MAHGSCGENNPAEENKLLWCDLKTDKERAEFIRSGRAVATGIMTQIIADDVADAFEFRSEWSMKYRKDEK